MNLEENRWRFPEIKSPLLSENLFEEIIKESASSTTTEDLERQSTLVKMLLKTREENDITPPLNAEEAEILIKDIQRTLGTISAVKEQVILTETQIDELVRDNVADLTFTTSKKRVKRAIAKSFKTKTDRITYDMYKEALRMKSLLEKTQTKEYLKGKQNEE